MKSKGNAKASLSLQKASRPIASDFPSQLNMPQPSAMPAAEQKLWRATERGVFYLSDTTNVAKLSPAIEPGLTMPCVRWLCHSTVLGCTYMQCAHPPPFLARVSPDARSSTHLLESSPEKARVFSTAGPSPVCDSRCLTCLALGTCTRMAQVDAIPSYRGPRWMPRCWLL